MAISKICGIETEYGIIHRGVAESNPITASSFLISAYLHDIAVEDTASVADQVKWNFEDESPGNDARGVAPTGAMPPEIETNMVNAVLTNGARYYVDHAHPELSTPECADPRSVAVYDRAAELILKRSIVAANARLPQEQSIVIFKNNSDGKGNSYGTHENYLVDRDTPFGRIVTFMTAHFITRQIYTGAGKVGCELPGMPSSTVPYQLTSRADFFEEEVGLETTLKRPIINTRDEPHADPQRYRRLHVIVGDANMSSVQTMVKVGTSNFMLAMIEDDWLSDEITFDDPVRALQQVSYDLDLSVPIRLANGSTTTALAVQWSFFEAASQWADANGFDLVGGDAGREVLNRWEAFLTGLESDPDSLHRQIDWIAKKRLLEGMRERHGIGWDDPRLRALDLQYHELTPGKSLFDRLGMEEVGSLEEVHRAVTEPPDDTRAYFRGRCLSEFGDQIAAANWDSLVFDLGPEPMRRVPMMDPAKGTKTHVGALIDSATDAADLLDRITS